MKNLCETFIRDLYQEYKKRGSIEEERGFKDSIENGVNVVMETIEQLCHMKNSQSCSDYLNGIKIAIDGELSSFPKNLLKRTEQRVGREFGYSHCAKVHQ